MNDTLSGSGLLRRKVLAGCAALAAAPLVGLTGCGDDQELAETGGNSGGGGAGASGASSTSATSASSATTSSTSAASTSSGGEIPWATGGTASMGDDYADPFTEAPGPACSVGCATTLGPCYAATLERKDISEGVTGLPMRLALLVVDDTCVPVEGASVDVWHTSLTGLYSGEDAAAACTQGDEAAKTQRFFRGVQSTDGAGRVDFDSCLPGGYPGRTLHVHFTVRVGTQEYVTSQLFFPSALVDDVYATQPEYAALGSPPTSNAEDGFYFAENEVSWAKMEDGVLLAWKVLVLRSSLADPLCNG
jgi:protocatechuate 3,4-dioxygenase beta subunit